LVKTLKSPGFPYRVEFTPNGKYALLPHARSGSLVVGDVASQSIVKQIPLGLTQVDEPSTAGVFPHPDNIHAFVTVRNDNSMLIVNIETGETLAIRIGRAIGAVGAASTIFITREWGAYQDWPLFQGALVQHTVSPGVISIC